MGHLDSLMLSDLSNSLFLVSLKERGNILPPQGNHQGMSLRTDLNNPSLNNPLTGKLYCD